MAWCRQARSHCLIQCWPNSMSLYGVTRPQGVKCECVTLLNRPSIHCPICDPQSNSLNVLQVILDYPPRQYLTGLTSGVNITNTSKLLMLSPECLGKSLVPRALSGTLLLNSRWIQEFFYRWPWRLITWLLVYPRYHQPCYSICRMNVSVCSMRKRLTPCSISVMMTSSIGNIFRVTGHLCGEFTGHRQGRQASLTLSRP